jgi:hypothetical protein
LGAALPLSLTHVPSEVKRAAAQGANGLHLKDVYPLRSKLNGRALVFSLPTTLAAYRFAA